VSRAGAIELQDLDAGRIDHSAPPGFLGAAVKGDPALAAVVPNLRRMISIRPALQAAIIFDVHQGRLAWRGHVTPRESGRLRARRRLRPYSTERRHAG